MITLHADQDMAAQLQRTFIGAYADAADLGEALAVAGRVEPGDYGQWHEEWARAGATAATAARAAQASGLATIAARGYLRSSEYHRQSYYFLRHNVADQRVTSGFDQHREMFRAALPLLAFRAEAVAIPFDPAPLPGYLFRPAQGAEGRPTVVFTSGFDSTAEEMTKYGQGIAVELGWNALAFDGPGQGAMLVEHGVTMRPDFENVLTPVIDWLIEQPYTDPERLLLVGRSLGGYLAPRAASAEHRLAALVGDPGQYNFTSRFRANFTAQDWQRVLDADPEIDADLEGFLAR